MYDKIHYKLKKKKRVSSMVWEKLVIYKEANLNYKML